MKKALVNMPAKRGRGRPPGTGRKTAPQVRIERAAGRLLSNKEKAVLCQLARLAWDHLRRLDLVEGKFEDWRRAEQSAATGGIASLRDCTRDHWRPIAARFYSLLGWTHRAFLLWMATGKATDASAPEDTHEAREEALHLIRGALAEHARVVHTPQNLIELHASEHARKLGGPIGEVYIAAIARIQHGRGLESLTAPELERMLFTTRNRIAAREGRGETKRRNKKQNTTAKEQRKEDAANVYRPRF